MWFKVFIALRLPVGVICMIGYVSALSLSNDQRMGALGAVLAVSADFFLWVTWVKLFRHRKSALRLAWWLLALETVGGSLLLGAADYTNMRGRARSPYVKFLRFLTHKWKRKPLRRILQPIPFPRKTRMKAKI